MVKYFIGRQPIFDCLNEVMAYDLFYRSSLDVGARCKAVAASRLLLDAFTEVGIENISGRKRVLVCADAAFLVDFDLSLVPVDRVVLAISNDLRVSSQVADSVRSLKSLGYTIALTGYSRRSSLAELLECADMIKIDSLNADDYTLLEELSELDQLSVAKIADRVETVERRNRLAGLGFEYFQGPFVARPMIVTGKRMPTRTATALDLVRKTCDPELSSNDLATLIAHDVSLSLRVLRLVNSPMTGLRREIDSIQQAVVLLGRETIKSLAALLALSGLDNDVPELVTIAFVRAKVCEQLAVEAEVGSKDSFFTAGLFSLMGAILGADLESIIEILPFNRELKEALVHRMGVMGEAIDCVEALESGAPDGAMFRQLPGPRIARIYLNSIAWADRAIANVC